MCGKFRDFWHALAWEAELGTMTGFERAGWWGDFEECVRNLDLERGRL